VNVAMNTSGSFRSLRGVIVILLSMSQVNAAEPLRLKISTVTSNVRSDAPLSLDVHLDWAPTDLLEGRLELTCYDGEKLLHRNVGSDVVLLAGDRHSRTVLPPMSLSADLSVLTVKARFLTDTSNYDLGSFELRVPVHWRRSFVIGIVVPHERAGVKGSAELGQSLRLDQLCANEIRGRKLVSIPSQITPEDLRASGLGLFSYDVLALTNPGFKVLAQNQLDAIGDWVEAGGSLFVIVDSTNSTAQSGFLNRIAGLPENDQGMLIGTDRLPSGGIRDQDGSLGMYRAGLGRSVILHAEEQTEAVADLGEAAAYLWKVRSELQSEFRDTGASAQLSKRLSESEFERLGNWRTGGLNNSELMYSPFQKVRLAEMGSLTTILLPDDVKSIPLNLVVLILALFLIVIVPVDYFVLGYFNCRRFTWILLPVVSLMFTGFTTWLGNAYLGSTDHRTSLEFVDMTTGNRVIRNSRFEMLFTATQREVATELKQTVHAGVSLQRGTEADEWNAERGRMTSDVAEESADRNDQSQDSESALYQGNMPALFTVRQQMRKWSPQLSRQTALQTERRIPEFDLDDIRQTWQQSSGLLADAVWQGSLREKIQTALPDATVLLFTKNQIRDLTQGEHLRGSNGQVGPAETKHRRLVELVRKVCVRPAVGLFSIVSQVSPNGAGDFEDLSILDPNDPGQLLLVIVTRQGNDYVVFRRLFHKGS
jgi:hypothetical protein